MKKTTAGQALMLWLLAGAVLLCCDHGGTGAQAVTTLNVSWAQNVPRAFLRLKLLPIDRHGYCINAQRLSRLEGFVQLFKTVTAGIVRLAAKDEERLAVDRK